MRYLSSDTQQEFLGIFVEPLKSLPIGQFSALVNAIDLKKTFHSLRFDLTTEALTDLSNEMMSQIKRVNDEIASIPAGQNSFKKTILPLANLDQDISAVAQSAEMMQHVSQNKEIRDASTEASRALSKFHVDQSMRVDLYESVKDAAEQKEALDPEQQRLVDRMVRDYKRLGLHLDEKTRNRIKEIRTRMSDLGISFDKNLTEENTKHEFTKDELAGLGEDFLEGLPCSEDGAKYVCSLKYPVYFPLMDNCKVPETRAKMEKSFNSRCMEENTPIIEELVKLRHEQAQLLGFPTHSSYALDIRMAKNPESVIKFLTDLSEKLDPLLDKDLEALLKLKKKDIEEMGREFDGVIHPYDVRYYSNMRKKIEFSVDDEKIKEFFPLHVVLDGMFEIYQEVLSLNFTKIDGDDLAPYWHDEVEMYQVNDAHDGRLVGYFYMDIHPRDGKYGHAAAFDLVPGCDIRSSDGTKKRQYPAAAMVCNFPASTESRPSLLRHDDVVTLFHEFGHIMHFLCAENVEFSEFSGFDVETDFVEAPSQMLENWCWEAESLLKMSGHYQDTSRKLPDELLGPLTKSKNANSGLTEKRQLVFGLLDQTLHSQPDVDTGKIYAEVQERVMKIVATAGTNMVASFSHIAGGYDAQYYGYMWSNVFAADMFHSRFLKEGLLNPFTGKSYRNCILGSGGSLDADVMLKNFLGRDPTMDAFLISKGLQNGEGYSVNVVEFT